MEWEGRKEEREKERDRRTDIQRDRHAVSAAIMSCVSAAAAAAAVTSWSTSAPIQLRLAPPARTISPSVRPSIAAVLSGVDWLAGALTETIVSYYGH